MSSPICRMTGQTMFGLEDLLVAEPEGIGALDIEKHNRAVGFRGDAACKYRANLCLRNALRILVPVDVFEVRNEDDLHRGIKRIKWEEFMDVDDTLAINRTLDSDLSTTRSSSY